MIVIITVTNVADLDLNLLRVLHAVLSERSATRAARQLHVTQSAVSNSLSTLRKIFGDPLVVRSGRGLSGTPRADELKPLIASALAQLESVFERQEPFDRLRTTR